MNSPRRSYSGSDLSTGSVWSKSGGPHLRDWPLGRSTTQDRYIQPVPPTYVTEYEANYTWPKPLPKPSVDVSPDSSKVIRKPWEELEQAVEELAELEELEALAISTKQQVHEHLLAENIEKAYKYYKAKLAQSQPGHEEEKKGSGDGDSDGKAKMRGVGGGGYVGSKAPVPRIISDTQKDRAEQTRPKKGTGGQKDGSSHGASHDPRITEAFREKMAKFCESVEALKRGETGSRQTK